jgi:hypothetical protein
MNCNIYKIYSLKNPDEIYIGSTKQDINIRFNNHKLCYDCYKRGTKKYYTRSYSIFDKYTKDTCKVELIESFIYNNKKERDNKERYYIEYFDCVNKNIPSREHIESQKIYNDKNILKRKNKQKEYYIKNRDRIIQQQQSRYNLKKVLNTGLDCNNNEV